MISIQTCTLVDNQIFTHVYKDFLLDCKSTDYEERVENFIPTSVSTLQVTTLNSSDYDYFQVMFGIKIITGNSDYSLN